MCIRDSWTFKHQNSVVKIWQLIGRGALVMGAPSHGTTSTMDNLAMVSTRSDPSPLWPDLKKIKSSATLPKCSISKIKIPKLIGKGLCPSPDHALCGIFVNNEIAVKAAFNSGKCNFLIKFRPSKNSSARGDFIVYCGYCPADLLPFHLLWVLLHWSHSFWLQSTQYVAAVGILSKPSPLSSTHTFHMALLQDLHRFQLFERLPAAAWRNKAEYEWNEKCNDLKCVRKPTQSRLSLTHHANKSSCWAE